MDNHISLLKRSRRLGGFTLVEMAVVMVLSIGLLAAFYSLLSTQALTAMDESSEIRVQTGIRNPMTELVEVLQNAHLFALDSYGNWVCFQVPRRGPSGSVIMGVDVNNNPVPQLGAYAFSTDGTYSAANTDGSWLPGGYYQIVFRNHTGPNDVLIESQLVAGSNSSGQNLSGTNTTGATAAGVTYDKGYQVGHFEIEVHTAPPNTAAWIAAGYNITPNAYSFAGTAPTATPPAVGIPSGAIYTNPISGLIDVQVIPGTALRQIDPADSNTPKRTSPWGGGFFFMRNSTNNNFVYAPITGLAATMPTATWSAQSIDGFPAAYDSNGSGHWEPTENYDDLNKNNSYDGPDCDSFTDTNGNNVPDGSEKPLNWKGRLRIQMLSFDTKRLVTKNATQYALQAAVRTISTTIQIRN